VVRHGREQRRTDRNAPSRFLIDRRAWRAAAVASVASVALLAAAVAYRDGAPPGFSGGFGEESCRACHFEAELNEPPGHLELIGIPASYTPGEAYPLTIALTRPGMALGGFELTARFEDGTQAGALEPGAGDVDRVGIAVKDDTRVLYGHQRDAGSSVSGGTARWTLRWTAPTSGPAVLFHVAANAADGDGSAEGDYVYTTARASLLR
jgi:hypothetical protein